MRKAILMAVVCFLFFGASKSALAGRDEPFFSGEIFTNEDSWYSYLVIKKLDEGDETKKMLYLGKWDGECRWLKHSHYSLLAGSHMVYGRFIFTREETNWCVPSSDLPYVDYTVVFVSYNEKMACQEDVYTFKLKGGEDYVGHDTFLLNNKEVLVLRYEQDYDANSAFVHKVFLNLWSKERGVIFNKTIELPSSDFFSVNKGAVVNAFKAASSNKLRILFFTKNGREMRFQFNLEE